MKLNVKAMAITIALVWGLGIFMLTWWIILFEGPNTNPNILTHIYRGYSITPMGSVIGLLWALSDGLVGGACIAWIYNMLLSKNGQE